LLLCAVLFPGHAEKTSVEPAKRWREGEELADRDAGPEPVGVAQHLPGPRRAKHRNRGSAITLSRKRRPILSYQDDVTRGSMRSAQE
jgi:hypothetical protein